MAYGVISSGFNLKTVDVILDEIQQDELLGISPSLDLQPTNPIGVVNGIVADAVAQGWEVLAALYSGQDPDAAVDDQLVSIALITGTAQRDALATVVTANVTIGAGFSAAPGTMIANIVGRTDLTFSNKALVNNPGGSPVSIDAIFEATVPGPTQCLAGTLTEINQPLTGWTSITNATDGTVGRAIESNESLRARREAELTRGGSATAAAIRADILEQLPLTTSCTVLQNVTDVTDANGLPPHSIEAIAELPGGTSDDDHALATLLLNNVAAGIQTYSGFGTFDTVIDDQGFSEDIFYTRPNDMLLYIEMTIITDATKFPVDGVAQVKQALIDFAAANYDPGALVFVKRLADAVFLRTLGGVMSGVIGVLDWTVFKIDVVTPAINTANFGAGIRTIPKLDTTRITITVTT